MKIFAMNKKRDFISSLKHIRICEKTEAQMAIKSDQKDGLWCWYYTAYISVWKTWCISRRKKKIKKKPQQPHSWCIKQNQQCHCTPFSILEMNILIS